jgi:hypothetical protein
VKGIGHGVWYTASRLVVEFATMLEADRGSTPRVRMNCHVLSFCSVMLVSQKSLTFEREKRFNGESHNINGVIVRLNLLGGIGRLAMVNNRTGMLQITTAFVTVRGIGHGVWYTASPHRRCEEEDCWKQTRGSTPRVRIVRLCLLFFLLVMPGSQKYPSGERGNRLNGVS